jgi:hypothetical protein
LCRLSAASLKAPALTGELPNDGTLNVEIPVHDDGDPAFEITDSRVRLSVLEQSWT